MLSQECPAEAAHPARAGIYPRRAVDSEQQCEKERGGESIQTKQAKREGGPKPIYLAYHGVQFAAVPAHAKNTHRYTRYTLNPQLAVIDTLHTVPALEKMLDPRQLDRGCPPRGCESPTRLTHHYRHRLGLEPPAARFSLVDQVKSATWHHG